MAERSVAIFHCSMCEKSASAGETVGRLYHHAGRAKGKKAAQESKPEQHFSPPAEPTLPVG
jgi:hypothetical protein